MKVLTIFDCYGCHDVVEVVVMRAGGSLIRAHTYDMARAILSKDPPQLVICDRALDDGKWQDLLDFESVKAGLTLVVVTSRLADENLWAEVLNLGGYDVLVQPLDEREVTRLVCRDALA